MKSLKGKKEEKSDSEDNPNIFKDCEVSLREIDGANIPNKNPWSRMTVRYFENGLIDKESTFGIDFSVDVTDMYKSTRFH